VRLRRVPLEGDDSIAAGRPLLAVSDLGRASSIRCDLHEQL